MERTELPIAVFDSGLGGISVLRALVQRLPGEDFLYFGDSANAPYGVRPAEEVRRLTQDVIARLYDRGIKAAGYRLQHGYERGHRLAARRLPTSRHRHRAGAQAAVAHHRRVLVLPRP
ncbi:MAG: glutamate racemase [Oscillospiraceae bacterium]